MNTFVLQEKFYRQIQELESSLKFQRATARELIYRTPQQTKAVVLTIGEICPGTNVVLRSLVRCLENEYGVKNIFSVRWGFRGFFEEYPKYWSPINSSMIEGIQRSGGSYLGTCRHVPFDAEKVVDILQKEQVN